jgi:hypothetical protein
MTKFSYGKTWDRLVKIRESYRSDLESEFEELLYQLPKHSDPKILIEEFRSILSKSFNEVNLMIQELEIELVKDEK